MEALEMRAHTAEHEREKERDKDRSQLQHYQDERVALVR